MHRKSFSTSPSRVAGINTDTLSQIHTCGKGGWFMRVSKRQYPSLRHGENSDSTIRTPSTLQHPQPTEMAFEIDKYNSLGTLRSSLVKQFKKSKSKPLQNKNQKVKPLLLITKPESVEKSKIYNFRSSSAQRRSMLSKLKEIKSMPPQTSRTKPMRMKSKK
mmetsp:Transcript_25425/g.25181  ORF Transcript_25425/g.25181 Transcript_25425/m.25181 type:complete len:161 (-) Transcript_25425:453-935(-)